MKIQQDQFRSGNTGKHQAAEPDWLKLYLKANENADAGEGKTANAYEIVCGAEGI